MRIGIDLASLDSPDAHADESPAYRRLLVESLISLADAAGIVLYAPQGFSARAFPTAPCVRWLWLPSRVDLPGDPTPPDRLGRIVRENPDGLDWLLTFEPGRVSPDERAAPGLRLATLASSLASLPSAAALSPYHRVLVPTDVVADALRARPDQNPGRYATVGLACQAPGSTGRCPLPLAKSAQRRLHAVGIRKSFFLALSGSNGDHTTDRAVGLYSALPEALRRSFQLIVAGSEPGRQSPVAPPAVSGVGRHPDVIHLTGAPGDLRRLLREHAAALLDMGADDGFPLPIVEAMLAGAIVVTRDGSSGARAVGDAGVVVSSDEVGVWAEAVARVLDDWTATRELRERAVQRGLAFRAEGVGRRVLEALAALEPIRHPGRLRVDGPQEARPHLSVGSVAHPRRGAGPESQAERADRVAVERVRES